VGAEGGVGEEGLDGGRAAGEGGVVFVGGLTGLSCGEGMVLVLVLVLVLMLVLVLVQVNTLLVLVFTMLVWSTYHCWHLFRSIWLVSMALSVSHTGWWSV